MLQAGQQTLLAVFGAVDEPLVSCVMVQMAVGVQVWHSGVGFRVIYCVKNFVIYISYYSFFYYFFSNVTLL